MSVATSDKVWAHFLEVLANVDEEAKELIRKTRPVAFRQHIADSYYVFITGSVMCINIRKFHDPYGLPNDQIRPSKIGLTLIVDEWAQLMQMIPQQTSAKICRKTDAKRLLITSCLVDCFGQNLLREKNCRGVSASPTAKICTGDIQFVVSHVPASQVRCEPSNKTYKFATMLSNFKRQCQTYEHGIDSVNEEMQPYLRK